MCKVFYYKKATFSPESGVLTLDYAVDDAHSFTEEICFSGAPFRLSARKQQALEQVFALLHVAAGISYYKAFLPNEIQIETAGLTQAEAEFFDRFYLSGLGEFAVRNRLNLQGKIHFPHNPDLKRTAVGLDLPYGALVPVGGGKDSCVTMELIKQTDLPAEGIAVGNADPIVECMRISGLPSRLITRKISEELLRLNQTGGVYNGHVPITGILAFVLWAAAILYDKKYVIMSCERSASSGNLMQGELEINHQYSKSFAFERDFRAITQEIVPDFLYFSLLRPISEIHIAKLFAKLCAAYFPAFTSCNKAFKLDPEKRLKHWCGDCDKCRFVFLILAPFMDKERLIQIVGKNPLNEAAQLDGYRELLGLKGHKPFECVGEVEECRWALLTLAKNGGWKEDIVVRELAELIPFQTQNVLFVPDKNHLIPEELKDVVDAFKR